MKPAPFELLQATSISEALQALSNAGEDSSILAGGQSLIAMLNLRLLQPNLVVDISRIKELGYIKETGDFIEIGATITQQDLQSWPDINNKLPLLSMALPHVGHPQTRSRGTICGSIAHADPSSEIPLVLALLNGRIILRSAKGVRTVKASEFQVGTLATARRTNEMVSAVQFPIQSIGDGFAFEEVSRRRGDFAIIAMAARATKTNVELAIGGATEKAVITEFDNELITQLDDYLNDLAWKICTNEDIHATASYRRHLVRKLGRKVMKDALSCRG